MTLRSIAENIVDIIFGSKKSENSFSFSGVAFPEYKKDFSDGVYGESLYDFTNAVEEGCVEQGDVIEFQTIRGTETYLFLERDTFLPTSHKFYPAEPSKDMLLTILRDLEVLKWRKVGHITSEEWNKKVRALKTATA